MSELKSATVETGAVAASLSTSDDHVAGHTIVDDETYVDPLLEKRAMRKFDWYMLPQFAILPFISFLDRYNIGNARVFGLEQSLGFTGNDFGDVNTIFFASYVLFQIPWVMSIKRWGAKTVIPISFISWSLVTLGTGFVQNYAQMMAMRILLGIFESGLFPGLTFLISTIWSRETQAKRVAVLYVAGAASGAFGGLIAYGIQLMGDQRGLEAWRWLFIVEGCISIVLCAGSWFTLPKDAETAYFLTPEEKVMMANRKRRDIVFKGDDKFDWKYARMAFKDVHIYLAAFCSFCSSIPLFGMGTFMPTIIRGLGYTSIQANYLTIPVYAFGTICLVSAAYTSDRIKQRGLFAFFGPLSIGIGYAIFIGSTNTGAGYFALFLVAGGIYVNSTLLYTWVANNLKPDYKRSVGIPLFACLSNVSGTISSQIYPPSDGPRYIMGNSISLGMVFASMVGIAGIYLLLRRRNLKKQRLIDQGAMTNGHEDDKALDFKYIL
ncbi:hypothetical protein B0A52_03426 [Exophiala mesophila]|uniref:Major facilitator superfamily (MFS) profile domain-containing protein n=1 Tax=Exophiala mesophila TaxID=212818 RepID=A0A438N691_EXOME|nr:hypothetical protein B0A52_03426 [Exophiala mesophila]